MLLLLKSKELVVTDSCSQVQPLEELGPLGAGVELEGEVSAARAFESPGRIIAHKIATLRNNLAAILKCSRPPFFKC